MKNIPSIINNKGLTLIEVIIAMTILAFIMVSVVSITNTSLDNKDVIIAEDRELLQIESALDRIEWDFSQIYTPLFYSTEYKIDPRDRKTTTDKFNKLKSNPMYTGNGNYSMPNFSGHPIPIFKQEAKQSFEFYTKGHRRKIQDSKESNFAWVKYEFRQSEEEEKRDTLELVRFYAAQDLYNPELKASDQKPFILAEGITDFEFSFWNKEKEEFTPDLRNVKDGDRLIRGFKIKINWKRSSGIEETTERVYRSLWPYFEPEDLNEEKYKTVDGQGSSNGSGESGTTEPSSETPGEGEGES